jgi:hypothetical protein
MFRISLVCAFAAIAFAQPVSPLENIEGRMIMGGSASLASGVAIRFKSVLSPGNANLGSFGEGGISDGTVRIHRFMIDRAAKTYFGYDLGLTPDASGSYLATFEPLSKGEGVSGLEGDGLRPLPLAKYPAPQSVRDGDIIALDLMVSPDGKQKLTDYIEVVAHEPPAAATAARPRDFTLDDGPLTYGAFLMTIWVNGQKQEGMQGFTGKPGSMFWIGFPGQGRYVLSPVPYEGFTKAGAIRDNVMAFRDGGQEYELRFMSPVAGAGKAWNLYVLRDRTYEPRPNQRNMINMGTDRLENLVAAR